MFAAGALGLVLWIIEGSGGSAASKKINMGCGLIGPCCLVANIVDGQTLSLIHRTQYIQYFQRYV